jgi:hypothetical protein
MEIVRSPCDTHDEGGTVSAVVSDALSGPPSASIKRLVDTSTLGSFITPVVARDRGG